LDVIQELYKGFKLRDLGETNRLLGMEISRDRPNRRLYISQHQYTVNILDRFNMADCKPVTTPMEPGLQLTAMCPQTVAEQEEMKNIPYLSAVGALMYLATSTRYDISYAVGVLARFSANPGVQHWKAAKHLLRYLKGTIDFRLEYGPDPSSTELLTTFSDADFGGNKDTGKSTGGYMVRFGTGAVSWQSKLQPFVVLSTTEAEFISAVEAGKEIMWMRNILSELGESITGPSTLLITNLLLLLGRIQSTMGG
jgi:hypothetical protein